MKKAPEHLLEGNRNWVERINKNNPGFFEKLSKGQQPEILWIGCSDSRVPATEIMDMMPGSIFVHRNIANLVVNADINMLSVVHYAVTVLKVKHVVVCGHYGCGGVRAAMSNFNSAIINKWLRNIKDIYVNHKDEVNSITSTEERENLMVELNVKQQVQNLSKISFIQKMWEEGEFPYIHGWVYKLTDGLIKDLEVSTNSTEGLDDIYKYSHSD